MPDASGKLLADDYAKIQAWWQKHWHGPVACPICQSNDWDTGTHVAQAPRHGEYAFLFGTNTYPYIVVMCKICGYTLFFNAVKVGVVEPYSPESDTALSLLMLPKN
jgi:predicted nucleic-acid-binding Zn-ribbon protein